MSRRSEQSQDGGEGLIACRGIRSDQGVVRDRYGRMVTEGLAGVGDVTPADVVKIVDSDLLIEPWRRDDQGRGIYDVSAEMVVKQLRAAGVRAAFADPPEARLFNVQHSVWTDLVLAIVINFASSAAWDGLKALVHQAASSGRQMDLSLTTVEADGSRRELRIKGAGEEVLAVIDRLRGRSGG